MATLLPWLRSSIHLTIHHQLMCRVNVNDSSMSILSQRATEREKLCESSSVKLWPYHLWRRRKHTQWKMQAFPLTVLAFWRTTVTSVKLCRCYPIAFVPVCRPMPMQIALHSDHKKVSRIGKASFPKHQMTLDLVPRDKASYWSGGISETLALAMNWGSQLKELHLNRTVMWSHNNVRLALAWGGQIAFVTRAK